MKWQQLMKKAFQLKATDIHIEEELPVFLRYGNSFESFDECGVFPKAFLEDELGDVGKQGDFSYAYDGRRFRAHQYCAEGRTCYTLRVLPEETGNVESDIHADLWKEICASEEGLVLVTGPTGSGKSYTLASCLSYINRTASKHIITLEDPIEYMFKNDKSCFHQRELYRDVLTMEEGLKGALREDPDIIMIGEMRDGATVEAALKAAETGHLVFATLHTASSVQAIGRILSFFSGEQQEEIRNVLSHVLLAIVCQRLLRSPEGFYPLRDILLNNQAVSNLIRQGKEHQIVSIQETQRFMQTFKKAIEIGERTWKIPYDWSYLKEHYRKEE